MKFRSHMRRRWYVFLSVGALALPVWAIVGRSAGPAAIGTQVPSEAEPDQDDPGADELVEINELPVDSPDLQDDRPDVDGPPGGGLRGGDIQIYDVAPCGGNGLVDLDDLFGFIDAFAGIYGCNCPAVPGGLWAANGTHIYNTNTGNVGIGTTSPAQKLSVAGTIQSTSGGMRFPDETLQTTAGGACVRTIANLRALAVPAAIAGDPPSVSVLGYYAASDGGGGPFYWDAASTEAQDGGLIIASSNPSPTGRWKRAFSGPVHAAWWGLAGNGITDDTLALQRAFNAAAGRGILFTEPKTYSFGPLLTIPNDVWIANNNATFRLRSSLPIEDGTAAITLGDRVRADLLKIHVAGGVTVRRLVSLGNNNDIERVEASSVDQQTVFQGNLDGALQVRTQNVRLGKVLISNFDYGVMIYFASHVVIERVDVRSYLIGVHVFESSFIQILSGEFAIAAPSALMNPHDGLLLDNSNDLVFSDMIIHDAGGHAIRVGGDGNSSRFVFNNIQTIRPGGCGLKIRANPGSRVRDVQINGLTVVDASAGYSEPGFNKDGLRLEGCSYVTVNGVQVQAQSQTYAAHDGIWVTNCDFVTINGPRISNVFYNGIHLNDSDGPVNQIFINNPVVLFSLYNGILINSPTHVLRDITVMRCYIRHYQQWGIRLNPAVVNQPVILDGFIRNDVGIGGVLNSTADSDVHSLVTVY